MITVAYDPRDVVRPKLAINEGAGVFLSLTAMHCSDLRSTRQQFAYLADADLGAGGIHDLSHRYLEMAVRSVPI